MKEKLIAITIGIFIFLVVGGMLYMAIKNPYQYPGYDIQTPPHYSPYPVGQISSCIKNPEWCY